MWSLVLRLLIPLVLAATLPQAASAQQTLRSSISVPLSIDLGYLEQKANAEIPGRLVTIKENNMLCVPAKWGSTDLPCVKDWYKITTCRATTKLSPDIHCDVSGYVNRRGNISLSGSGNSLTITLPVKASVSAKAVVQETADAEATFFVNAIPSIGENWSPSLEVKADFRWDKRPELKLFNFIKITITDKVEPELRKKLKEFEAQIPGLVQGLNVRNDVEKVWNDIQKPIQISSTPNVYALFKPTNVGFSGINIVGKELKAQVLVEGDTSVVVGSQPAIQSVQLLPLKKIQPTDGAFNLAVPAVIEEAEIQSAIDAHLQKPLEAVVDQGGVQGLFTASNIRVSLTEDKGIRITSDVEYDNRSKWLRFIDIFNWFDFTGTAEMQVVPVIDPERNIVRAESIRLAADTSSDLADTLIDVLNMPIIREKIAELVQYDFSGDLDRGLKLANEAINVSLENGVKISGSLDKIGAKDLKIINDAITVFAHANGKVQASLGK